MNREQEESSLLKMSLFRGLFVLNKDFCASVFVENTDIFHFVPHHKPITQIPQLVTNQKRFYKCLNVIMLEILIINSRVLVKVTVFS